MLELVIVLVIVGLLASMAIPRLGRGSVDAGRATVRADLAIVRGAIARYAAEHGQFPGPTGADVAAQLTQYSSHTGATSVVRDAAHRFGPYLVRIPPLKVGVREGHAEILVSGTSPPTPDESQPAGWVYNPVTGEFYPNVGGAVAAQAAEAGEPSAAAAAVETGGN